MGRYSRRFGPRLAAACFTGFTGYAFYGRATLEMQAAPQPPTAKSDAQTLTRSERISKLTEKEFDVVVIGGGFKGLMCAIDAAQRGMSVALLEGDDYGSGAASTQLPMLTNGWVWCQRALRQRDPFFFGRAMEEIEEYRYWRTNTDQSDKVVVPTPTMVLSAHLNEQIEQTVVSTVWSVVSFTTAGFAAFSPFTSSYVKRSFPDASDDVDTQCGGVWVDYATVAPNKLINSMVNTAERLGVTMLNHSPVVGVGKSIVEQTGETTETTKEGEEVKPPEEVFMVNMVQFKDDSVDGRKQKRQPMRFVRGASVINASGAWSDIVRGLITTAQPRFVDFLLNTSFVCSTAKVYKSLREDTVETFKASAIIASSPFMDQPSLGIVPVLGTSSCLVGACAARSPALPTLPSELEGNGKSCKEEADQVSKAATRLGIQLEQRAGGVLHKAVPHVVPLLNCEDPVSERVFHDGFAVDVSGNVVHLYGGGLLMARRVAEKAVDAVLPLLSEDRRKELTSLTSATTSLQLVGSQDGSHRSLQYDSLVDYIRRDEDVNELFVNAGATERKIDLQQHAETMGTAEGWNKRRVGEEVERAKAYLETYVPTQ